MKLDYFGLFKFAIMIFGLLLMAQWLPEGCSSIRDSLPAGHHTPEYNRFAWIMIGIGGWGLLRLLNRKRKSKHVP